MSVNVSAPIIAILLRQRVIESASFELAVFFIDVPMRIRFIEIIEAHVAHVDVVSLFGLATRQMRQRVQTTLWPCASRFISEFRALDGVLVR